MVNVIQFQSYYDLILKIINFKIIVINYPLMLFLQNQIQYLYMLLTYILYCI